MTWKAVFEGIKISRERRMFVFFGSFSKNLRRAKTILKDAKKSIGKDLLYVGEFPKDSDKGEERFLKFKDIAKDFKIQKKPFATARDAMGRTYDILVIDAFENFPPSEIGILVETVRGPGIIIVFMPPSEKWVHSKTVFHERTVLTPPYNVEDCADTFNKRLLKKFMEHNGIYVFEDGKLIKKPREEKKKVRKKTVKIPKKSEIPAEVYEICATNDQVRALKDLEKNDLVVLLANRGRGKSASIGLFLSFFVKKKKKRIIVTGPSYKNVEEVFRFAKKGLKAQKAKYRSGDGWIRVKRSLILFKEPLDAVREKADLIVVDEAAGIYVSVLEELKKVGKKTIFSTTTHGYEGTGRLFQYRFLPSLENPKIVKLEEPIRYGENDPIEKWLYDVFLLDAEPVKVTQEIRRSVERKKLKFVEIDKERMFLEEEHLLREFIGIYVYAHYRNNPRDIVILSDAPNQRAFAVVTEEGRVICSVQVAEEGNLPEDLISFLREGGTVQGNIVPDLMTKYYDERDIARKKGFRIVRIAVHPELQSKGIGSFALRELEKIAMKECSWYGAVFGASKQLINFWIRNGFIPVHISPKRNPESGEYSVLVLKVFEGKKRIEEINLCVKRRLAMELNNFYKNMEPEVAISIFSSGATSDGAPALLEPEIKKLEGFLNGSIHYDAVSDILYRVTVSYFLGKKEPKISDDEMKYLVEKVLKKRSWRVLSKKYGGDAVSIAKKVDKILRKISGGILNDVTLQKRV